jgi:phosphatidylethanolamine-binding protein (PEBP) family uncharacterized protein
MRLLRLGVAGLLLLVVGCGGEKDRQAAESAPEQITVSSPAFKDGGRIPARYTCDGDGPPPPLTWTDIPAKTKELVLLVEDPDAPGGIFLHWVLPHLEPAAGGLPSGGEGWRPPCPPRGDDPHHYRFSLYALGRTTDLTTDADGDKAHAAIEAADPLARGAVVGLYSRR